MYGFTIMKSVGTMAACACLIMGETGLSVLSLIAVALIDIAQDLFVEGVP